MDENTPEGAAPTAGPPPDENEAPEIPPLGEKTTSLLFSLLQDFYRQEIGAEEDVHRTLPFFATALGLIVASLNYAATQLPPWEDVIASCGRRGQPALGWNIIPCTWPLLLDWLSLSLVVCLSAAVLWYLFLATRTRNYTRVGPESLIVAGVRELHAHHAGTGASGDGLDTIVVSDVRVRLLDPFTAAVAANREVTLQRYRYRARAVLCLLCSLFVALVGTIVVIATVKFGIIRASP
jgi:hypothetical protein